MKWNDQERNIFNGERVKIRSAKESRQDGGQLPKENKAEFEPNWTST
jgi:hypothetical protein